jgi:hypothetical protein
MKGTMDLLKKNASSSQKFTHFEFAQPTNKSRSSMKPMHKKFSSFTVNTSNFSKSNCKQDFSFKLNSVNSALKKKMKTRKEYMSPLVENPKKLISDQIQVKLIGAHPIVYNHYKQSGGLFSPFNDKKSNFANHFDFNQISKRRDLKSLKGNALDPRDKRKMIHKLLNSDTAPDLKNKY